MKVVLCVVLLVVAGVMSQDFSNDFFAPQGQPMVMMMMNGRNSRGPVLFPTSPEGTETSGVIVGASGYGFVPPGRQRSGPVYNAGRQNGGFSGPNYGNGFF